MIRKLGKLGFSLLVLLPLGIIGVIVLTILQARMLAHKIDPNWNPSRKVLMWARLWTGFYRDVPLPFLLAILHNEGASEPRALNGTEATSIGVDTGTIAYPPGDLHISRGPSVGCGQVLRSNVERLWSDTTITKLTFPLPSSGLKISVRQLVVYDDPLKLALVGNERGAVWACVAMLREDIAASSGDLREAARRYNGSGSDAEAYADRVQDTLERIS